MYLFHEKRERKCLLSVQAKQKNAVVPPKNTGSRSAVDDLFIGEEFWEEEDGKVNETILTPQDTMTFLNVLSIGLAIWTENTPVG